MRSLRFRIVRCAVLFGVVYTLWRGFSVRVGDDTRSRLSLTRDPEQRRKLIKEAFIYGWKGYKKHAFPHDTLRPLTDTTYDDRSGWGCTAVDALTTAILLEVPEAVETSLDHIATIDWQRVSYSGLSIFGSTIRYMGAMLSAYDLLREGGPHQHLLDSASTYKLDMLLLQAQALADRLSPSFGTETGINTNFLNTTDGTITFQGINDITAISGLVLEWTHLSDLTGDSAYFDLAIRSFAPLLSSYPQDPFPFPGLLPKHVDVTSGVFDTQDTGGWSHAGGGMYEMLLKLSIYDPDRFLSYRQSWILAANSTIEYLASHPRGHPDLTFLADFNGTELLYQQDHSGMFAAASFLLGGMVTGERRFVDFGLSLVNTYVKIYAATETGIGPESFGWIPDTCDNGKESREEVCSVPVEYSAQEDSGFVSRAGYWATDTRYLLRPEVLESLYYAYRATNDEQYREMSWQILCNVVKWTKAGSAYAELNDVNQKMTIGGYDGRNDWMNSYMLTELFMYASIIHLDDAPWHLRSDGLNEWVFSTQAHPFKIKSPSSAHSATDDPLAGW